MSIHPIVRDLLVSVALSAAQEYLGGGSGSASRQQQSACDLELQREIRQLRESCQVRDSVGSRSGR